MRAGGTSAQKNKTIKKSLTKKIEQKSFEIYATG